MKKSLLSLVCAGVFAFWAVSAQAVISDLFDGSNPKVDWAYSQLLNWFDSSWGYSNNDSITCDSDNGIVTIKSPVLTDSLVYEAPAYRIFLSPYRVSSLSSNDLNVDTSRIIMKEVKRDGNSSEVEFSLSASDWIDENQAYFGFIVPINDYDEIGTPSRELCFQMSSNACMWEDACEALDNISHSAANEPDTVLGWEVTEQHGANCVWMDMANVSHTIDGNKITLTWTAVPDGDNVEIAIYDPKEEEYRSLKTVPMSDEKFEYTMEWDGEQNFSLTNGCRELRYKADAKMTTPPEEKPDIPVTPATGPAENILIIAIAAILIYGVYAVFFRKSTSN